MFNIIGIIGLGYVGLPLAIRYCEVGYNVIGFDIDQSKIDILRSKDSYIKHIDIKSIDEQIYSRFNPTTDFAKINEVDAIIICVPTPLNKHRDPDLSYITGTLKSICPHLKAGQILSLESTTYPGTTEEEIVPTLQKLSFNIGHDFFVVYSPEREDPANKNFVTATIPKVVGGYTPKCLEMGIELYKNIISKIIPVSSTRAAEMTKLLENIHRSVNIGLVNEMKIIADKMSIDIHEVIDAAATKPFGFTAFYPGPGLGGHCIPIDPFYLTWKAKEYGMHTRFIELSGEVNSEMPNWVITKITHALNSAKKPVNGSKILIIGAAYKKNVDDMRESPSLEIMQKLIDLGADIAYHDDFIPSLPKTRKHNFALQSLPLTPKSITLHDCVVIITDHDYIDYDHLLKHALLIVDSRGVYRNNNLKVIKA